MVGMGTRFIMLFFVCSRILEATSAITPDSGSAFAVDSSSSSASVYELDVACEEACAEEIKRGVLEVIIIRII